MADLRYTEAAHNIETGLMMKRYIFGVMLVCWLAMIPAQAQDAVDTTLVMERYQAGDALIVYTSNADQGETLVEALQANLPEAEVTLQTDILSLPENPARVLVFLPEKTLTLPADTGTRYGITERAETETAALVVFRRTPALLQPLAELGDSLLLMGWKIERNARIHPCDVLTLQSWWTITAPLPLDYSLTFALNPTDQDDGIARNDSAPAGSQTRLWQKDTLYYDERELTVPCDTPPGEYYLVAGIYDWTNGESLWVMPDDGIRVALMAVRITDD